MTWSRIDDGYYDHPKILALDPLSELLWLRAIAWASRHLTDGWIPESALQAIARKIDDLQAKTGELVSSGLWRRESGGWRIHDFLQYNPSRRAILERRRSMSEIGRLGGVASGRSRRKDRPAGGGIEAPRFGDGSNREAPRFGDGSNLKSPSNRVDRSVRFEDGSTPVPSPSDPDPESEVDPNLRGRSGSPPLPPPTGGGGGGAAALDPILDGLRRIQAEYPEGRRNAFSNALERVWVNLGPPDEATVQEIIAGIRAWRATSQWRDDGGRFVPNLVDFLRDRRWMDVPAKTSGTAAWLARRRGPGEKP